MSSGVMVARKRYITSRQVQKLSSSGPRRSTSPAMARWKAWLWTLATPGTATPEKRSASARGRTVGRDGRDGSALDGDQDVAPPSVVEQRARYMDLRHGSPALLSICFAGRRCARRAVMYRHNRTTGLASLAPSIEHHRRPGDAGGSALDAAPGSRRSTPPPWPRHHRGRRSRGTRWPHRLGRAARRAAGAGSRKSASIWKAGGSRRG